MNSSKTKIVIITNYWKGGHGGGITTYLIGLTKGLEEEGIFPNVIFRDGDDSDNYKIYGSKYLYPLKALFVLRKINPDVINSQGSWFCLLPGLLWKQFNRKRLIATTHTVTDEPSRSEKITMRFLLDRCDAVVFVSKHLEDQMKHYYKLNVKQSAIIHPGVVRKAISDEQVKDFKVKFGIPEGKILLLGQGLTAHRVKVEGVKRLILALKMLKTTNPNVLLILTRGSPYIPELKEFARRQGVQDSVIFTGELENPFIAVKASDILTHITLDDAFPIAILEAMTYGMPIVASAVGGIPEIINENNGRLVNNDPSEIAMAIEYLIKNRDIAKTLGKAAERDVAQYNWTDTAKIYRALLLST
jgi:L-malate glycosyltransferase